MRHPVATPHDRPRDPAAGQPRSRRQQAGMSMVEVLVVVLLFSFGLIGLVGVQARAVQFSVGAEDMGRAAVLANEIASQMWSSNTVNLPAATVSAWAARVADAPGGGLPNGTGTVTVSGNVARISITWRPPQSAVGDERRYVTDVLIATP